jgi:IS30 family transposase
LVIGKGHKGGFATLAERKSRLYLALPIANKTAQNANDAINKLLIRFGKASVTVKIFC